MDNQQSLFDDIINLTSMPEYYDNFDFSSWNDKASSSSEIVFSSQQDHGLGARDQPTDQPQVSGDQEMFLPANTAPSSRMISQHFLIRKQGMEDETWKGGRKDGLRPYFSNPDEGYTKYQCVDVVDHSVPGYKEQVNTSRYDNVALVPPPNHCSNPTAVVEDLSLRLKTIEEFNPASGLWDIFRTESSFSFNGSTYQYAYHKDSENREFRCCIDHVQGAPGVVMFEIKKQKWVQGCIHRPIPLVRTSSTGSMVSRLHVTTHILGCGGFIFVYSEQEIGRDVFSCVHRFNPDSFGVGMWEEIWVEPKSNGPDVRVYPEFTSVRPYSATLLQCGGSAFVFSEQESCDSDHLRPEVIICVQRRKRGAGGAWEPVMRRIKKRHRAPNWKPEEITAFLEAKVEALEAVQGKPDWDYISERLEQAGFNRGPHACEDQWGTQLKRLTEIENYVQANNIIPGTSRGWDDIWNMGEHERSTNNLPRVFTLDWYRMMERIHRKKPRKSKTGAALKSRNQRSAASTSHLNSTVTSSNSSGIVAVNFPRRAQISSSPTPPLTDSFDVMADEDQSCNVDVTAQVMSLCDYLLEGRQNLTNSQIARKKDEALKTVKSSLNLQIELVKLARNRQATKRRPRISRKTNIE